jgi:hypothetical protein
VGNEGSGVKRGGGAATPCRAHDAFRRGHREALEELRLATAEKGRPRVLGASTARAVENAPLLRRLGSGAQALPRELVGSLRSLDEPRASVPVATL